MNKEYKQYIGDSVYIDYDGFSLILTTENGLPGDPSNRIYLDPSVIVSLNNYVKWLESILTTVKSS